MNARRVLDDVSYAGDPYECARGAHALVIVTEWDAFRALDQLQSGRVRTPQVRRNRGLNIIAGNWSHSVAALASRTGGPPRGPCVE